VVFVDAAEDRAAGEVGTEWLHSPEPARGRPAPGAASGPGGPADGGDDVFSHGMRPPDLLGLTTALFGVTPAAVVVGVGAESFEPGWGLSDAVVRAIPQAVRAVMAAVGSQPEAETSHA
jgi:hypothetical protein